MRHTKNPKQITLNIVIDTIKHKIVECEIKYHIKAKYAKLPEWVLDAFTESHKTMTDIYNDSHISINVADGIKICGLIACPTNKIKEIEEIEVF